LALAEEWIDAGGEGCDAGGARSSTFDVCGDFQARGGAANRLGVIATIARFQSLGLTWPLPETVTDSELEAKLYKNAGKKQGHRRIAEPDWAILHREMKRKHVTLSILWDEYIEAHPDGYRYSRFCELYRSWEGKISVTDRDWSCLDCHEIASTELPRRSITRSIRHSAHDAAVLQAKSGLA
jgi:hypothetical protein